MLQMTGGGFVRCVVAASSGNHGVLCKFSWCRVNERPLEVSGILVADWFHLSIGNSRCTDPLFDDD